MIYDSDYFVGSALNGDSLSHHGVPNQRWGVKNGPPYPVKRGHDVHYSVGKMTDKTKNGLQKAGKITSSGAKAVGNAAKNIVKKTSSSFTRWKNEKKLDLATKPTDNALMKSWQKHQLRVSDMTNDDLQKRIDRKRLEEGYRRALRGDFTESKTWKGRDVQNGKKAVDNFMKTFGNAAVEGIAKGLSARLSNSISSKGQAKVARQEALKNAVAEVQRKAAAESAQSKADRKSEARQRQREMDAFQQALRDEENFRRYSSEFYDQRALPSGNSDMDELWKLYGPSV